MVLKNVIDEVKIKRAYEAPAPTDGYRVLVDRLWPRGINKDELRLDEWNKELAPTDGLRRWFGHDPAKWTEFGRRYRAELQQKHVMLDELVERSEGSRMTLVYGAKDEVHNNAAVLKDAIERRARQRTPNRKPRSKSPTRKAKIRRATNERTLCAEVDDDSPDEREPFG